MKLVTMYLPSGLPTLVAPGDVEKMRKLGLSSEAPTSQGAVVINPTSAVEDPEPIAPVITQEQKKSTKKHSSPKPVEPVEPVIEQPKEESSAADDFSAILGLD